MIIIFLCHFFLRIIFFTFSHFSFSCSNDLDSHSSSIIKLPCLVALFVSLFSTQADIDSGKPVEGTIHDVAGLVKQFLRVLPEPLLTYRLYSPFVQAVRLAKDEQSLHAIKLLSLELPEANLHCVVFLLRLLRDVVQSTGNRMSASNLAAIFTPNLLRPASEQGHVTSELELANHAVTVRVVELMILNSDLIGIPPPETVARSLELDEELAKSNYVAVAVRQPRWWWWL